VLQVPNAGHSLEGGRDLALSTLAAFFRHNVSGKPLPEFSWENSRDASGTTLTIVSQQQPLAARLWTAHSATKDFRESKWEARPLEWKEEVLVGRVAKPQSGHVAHYGELQFEFEGLPYSLCTLIQRSGE
jgi:PhoPQ-activated pathogenicity-related protein